MINPKVLLISAINEQNAADLKYPPLGLAYIASYLRKYQEIKNIKIINRNIMNNIQDFKPDIIGISSVSQNFNITKNIVNKIKQKYSLPILLGGHHISSLPNVLPENVDVGIIGEGEQTVLEIIKGNWLEEKTEGINGLVFRKETEIIKSDTRKLIDPIDLIPYPARDLIDLDNKRLHMITARGCPYKCTFCSSSHFWGKIRFHSAEYVVGEIEELIDKYNAREINIYDDLFIADRKRLKMIAQMIRGRNIHKKVEFNCTCRSNLVDSELIELLKEMNITQVAIGFESGSDRILKLLKGSVTVKQHLDAIRILTKAGIKIAGSIIIGSPYEESRDILQSYKFVKSNPINSMQVYVMTPFPGTWVWEYAKSKKLVNDYVDTDLLNVNFKENMDKFIVLSDKVNRKNIQDWYSRFESLNKKRRIYKLFKKVTSLSFLLDKLRHPSNIIKLSRNFSRTIIQNISQPK